jgi:hypothetical protein
MSMGRDDLGHRSETVRRVNLSTILRELHGSGPLSRSDLVTRTGLTRSAIRALIGELAAGNLVVEGPAALDGTPGRPSPVVRPFAEGAAVLALEIAVDTLAVAAVGLGGAVLIHRRIPLPPGRTGVDEIVESLAALAEHRRGAARGVDDVVLIWGSIGVGGGLIIDGEPLVGDAGYGGEVGHIPVNPDGRSCRCGSFGCWETEVGGHAVLRRAGYPPEAGQETMRAVLGDAEAGAPVALSAFAETGRWLGIGLAGIINLLNPRLVLLGNYLGSGYPYIRSTLQAELDRRVLPASRRIVRVAPTSLNEDAPLLGAAELAFEPLLNDPSAWLRPRQIAVAQVPA